MPLNTRYSYGMSTENVNKGQKRFSSKKQDSSYRKMFRGLLTGPLTIPFLMEVCICDWNMVIT